MLLGFNRPENIKARAREILYWNPSMLYISIDGPRNEKEAIARIETKEHLQEYKSNNKVRIIYRETNFGLEKHLPQAIDEVLTQHDGVIVIEDDVKCAPTFYTAVCEALNLYGHEYMTIGGFSPINFDAFLIRNRWRSTKYFSAWGWGVSRSSWEKYERNIDLKHYKQHLESGQMWHHLTRFQKNTWLGRFEKVASGRKKTWDFQMQYSSFKNDLLHLNVLFRICENVGFADIRGTNTKMNRPKLLGGEHLSQKEFVHKQLPALIQVILEHLDSIVIAGDRKMLHFLSKIRQLSKIWITGQG